jgi:nicotinamidase-related amidase
MISGEVLKYRNGDRWVIPRRQGGRPAPLKNFVLTMPAELVEELKPSPDDYVLIKKRRNAFYGTELDFHLRCRGSTTLVIGGVATDLGVENTVRDAWDRDFNVIVVEDLCVAAPPSAHDYAINSVFPRMARIMNAEQIVMELGKANR